jgi:hypothetical protein
MESKELACNVEKLDPCNVEKIIVSKPNKETVIKKKCVNGNSNSR